MGLLQRKTSTGALLKTSTGALAKECCCGCCGSAAPDSIDVTIDITSTAIEDALCIPYANSADGTFQLAKDVDPVLGAVCSWSYEWSDDVPTGSCSPDLTYRQTFRRVTLWMESYDNCSTGTWHISVSWFGYFCIGGEWLGYGFHFVNLDKDATEDWPDDWTGTYTVTSHSSDDSFCDDETMSGTAVIS